ncbi:BORG1 protein, partial [Eudromia elegans]|nr:BORG1 protein [Eudromia elegans]
MSAKVPIYLKRSSRKGKKEKLRDLLSSDMISPPLGDFRHTIHVGSGGERDTFGDVSFLQGKFHLLPHGSGAALPLSRAATVSGREPRAPESSSPLLKNAISLPALGGPQALTLPAAPPKPPRLHLDEDPGAPNGLAGRPEPLLPHAGSLLSLHVDLGPSILEDVLQVMEKHQEERGRREIPT